MSPYGLQPARLLCPWDSPSRNTGVGGHFLLQRIFPIQGWNPYFLHFRRILYQLSHLGSPSNLVVPRFIEPLQEGLFHASHCSRQLGSINEKRKDPSLRELGIRWRERERTCKLQNDIFLYKNCQIVKSTLIWVSLPALVASGASSLRTQ